MRSNESTILFAVARASVLQDVSLDPRSGVSAENAESGVSASGVSAVLDPERRFLAEKPNNLDPRSGVSAPGVSMTMGNLMTQTHQ